MRYYLDCEFVERPCTIDLLSLALVREDGPELYVVSGECDLSQASPFVLENVLPKLFHPDLEIESTPYRTRGEIRDAVLTFVGEDSSPVFYGWYADYDWVVFCWLFGPMVHLPERFPRYCRDLKQTVDEVRETAGIDLRARMESVPVGREHNALADARWIRRLHEQCLAYAAGQLDP